MWESLQRVDPQAAGLFTQELRRQRKQLCLIASENFASVAVIEAMASVLTNKYAEGYPGKRYYGGCQYVDQFEELAQKRAKELFGAEHANVQPHAGAQANMAVYFAVLEPGDTVLGMDLAHGGHLTHGSPVNSSGKLYNFVSYGVDPVDQTIHYDQVQALAEQHRPRLLIAGASAYPRVIDFARFAEIAQQVGAFLLVDMAHIAGLVAGGCHPSPFPHADFVTTTTHKTLRGPRGGMAFCKAAQQRALDKAVFPCMQGGPLMHVIAAKAVALQEALQPSFATYAHQVIDNAQALGRVLQEEGLQLISGGTENHLVLLDMRNMNLTGKATAELLERVGIVANKNVIPEDPAGPFTTSGLRLGTAALTTRGLGVPEMEEIGRIIAACCKQPHSESVTSQAQQRVRALTSTYPLYSEWGGRWPC